MGEGQLTLLLAVMPGVPAGGVILRRVHQRLVSRNCGQAMLLTDLVDKDEDVLAEFQILVQISGGRVGQGAVLGDRDGKVPLLAVGRSELHLRGTRGNALDSPRHAYVGYGAVRWSC